MFTKACDGGHQGGCANLGVMLDYGEGCEKDTQKALKLYQKACNSNVAMACVNLGIMYTSGIGLDKDLMMAKKMFQKGCKLKNSDGCHAYALAKSLERKN